MKCIIKITKNRSFFKIMNELQEVLEKYEIL